MKLVLAWAQLAWIVQLVWDVSAGLTWKTIKIQKHYRKPYKTEEKYRNMETIENYTRQCKKMKTIENKRKP